MSLDKIISYVIFSIWGLLLIMGIFTLLQPQWLQDLSVSGKNSEAISIKKSADNYLKNKRYGDAINLYKKALKIVPDLKGAIANLAVSYQKSSNFNLALITFKHLLKLNPEYPEVIYFNIAEIYEKQNDLDKAIKYYLLSAEHAAFPEESFQKAGHILMNNNEWEEAILNFKLAIENKKTFANLYKGMLINYRKSLDDTSSLFQEINNILESESYLKLQDLYYKQSIDIQIGNDTKLIKTYNNIGFCLAKIKRYDESVIYLKKALEMDPGFVKAKNNLMVVEGLKGKEAVK
ncbi:MAG: hypothetical protein C0595_05285 [Marinilabiliales bacterium]|nr:MAG: hypothetical protein C0595_05285 [Marinilabiliales bacterium]